MTIPFFILKKVIARDANRKNIKLPKLSLALSNLDDNMIWQVRDVENNLVAKVNGEYVEWVDE